MKTYQPILKLLLPLVLGILMSHYFLEKEIDSTYFYFSALIWIISTLLIHFIFRGNRNSVSIGMYVSFFFLGYALHNEHYAPNKLNFAGNISGAYYQGTIKQIKESGRFLKCETDMEYVINDWGKEKAFGRIELFIDSSNSAIKNNCTLLFSSDLIPITNRNNPGEFNAKQYANNKQIYHQVFCDNNEIQVIAYSTPPFQLFSWLNKQINSLLEKNLSGDVLTVAKGILLGDKSEIRMELKDAFSGAGAMHLLAVSGLHVGIFLVIIQWIFSTFLNRLPKWVEFTLLLILLWTYAGITGFSPSVNRAVTMFSFVAFGSVFGKNYNSINGLLASAMLLLIIQPNYLFDIGFQLSYLAMIGIFTFSPLFEKAWYIRNNILSKIWTGTSVALAAQITTFPLTLYYFHQFPNYFLITNLGLMVFSGVVLGIGLGLITIGSISFISSLIGMLLTFVVVALIYFIEWVNTLPFALTKGFQLDVLEVVFLYFIIALIYWSYSAVNKRLVYVSTFLALIFIVAQSYKWHSKYMNSEMIVMNHSYPIFFLKNGKQGALFVFSKHEDAKEKTTFLVKSLQNYYGIEILQYVINYPKGIVQVDNPNITFNHSNTYIELKNEKSTYYLTSNYFDIEELHGADKIIVGNWITEINYQSLINHFGEEKVYALKKMGALQIN